MLTALVVMVILLHLALGLVVYFAWHRLMTDSEILRGIVASITRPPLEGGLCPSAIRERPAMDAKARLEFYGGLAKLPQWPALAARFQAETRMYLIRSQAMLDDGKPEAAAAYAAMARLVSHLAILPEYELTQAQAALKQAESSKAMDDLLEASAGSQRPGRY